RRPSDEPPATGRRGSFRRQGQPEVTSGIVPPMRAPQTGCRQLSLHPLGPEFAGYLGEHLLAVGEVDDQVQCSNVDPLPTRRAQPHLDALLAGVPPRNVPERAEIEICVQFPIDYREHVAVELRCDAGTVVVGAYQPTRVLDEVGAEQQAVARLQRVRQRSQEILSRSRCQVADRRAEKYHQTPADARYLAEMLLEITTHRIDFDTRVFTLDGGSGRVEHPGVHVERDEPAQ